MMATRGRKETVVPQVDRELVLRMYAEPTGISTIAFKLRLSASTVHKIVRDAGVLRTREESLRAANHKRLGEKRTPYETI